MIIDAISNGIVIDHITAGKAMYLYKVLELDKLDCSVALLKNVVSNKLGRKDIIKIDRILNLDWDVIGCVDPGITVNFIKDGKQVEKRQLKLPTRIKNVIHCKNPRCITSIEQGLPTSLSSQMKNGRFTAVNTVKKNIVESCKNEGRRSTSTYSCGGFFMRWQLQMSSVVTLCPHGTEYQRRQCNSCRHGCCK